MFDMRAEPYKGFLEYHAAACRMGECDVAYPVMQHLCKAKGLDTEQRYWLAFLYASTYCVPTAWFIFQRFPQPHDFKLAELSGWYGMMKKGLLFQTDRRWVSFNDELPEMIDSWRTVTHNSAKAFYEGLCTGTPEDNYTRIMEATDGLYYFSRFSRFLLFEAIAELTQLPIRPRPEALDLSEGGRQTCRRGLNCVLGEPQQAAQKKLPKHAYPRLQEWLRKLTKDCQRAFPDFETTVWSVETNLCAWYKMFKGTRYWGYYVDRGQEEIQWYEKHYPTMSWDLAWEARRVTIHKSLLGEVNGWHGIRKELLTLFPRKGILQEAPLPLCKGRPSTMERLQ